MSARWIIAHYDDEKDISYLSGESLHGMHMATSAADRRPWGRSLTVNLNKL